MTSDNKKSDFTKSALSELFQKSRGIAERFLGQKKGAGSLSVRRRGRRAATPTSEQLEIRALLSTFMVTSTADTGAGSLRQAIDDANLNSGDDTIEFNLPGSSNQTITLASQISVTDNVTIDASGFAPGVTISGGNTTRMLTVNPGTSLTLDSLTLTEGSSVGSGGAILNQGNLAVFRSTFSNNRSFDDSGAIANPAVGTLTISDSTFTGNVTSNDGGAIRSSGTATIVNSTFANNSAGIAGGGIRNDGTLNITNSIVSDNTAQSSNGPDFFGTIVSGGYNLIEDTNSLTITGSSTGNILGQSALLGPLGNYGGSTRTMPISANSPAFNAGDPSILSADQRGQVRIGLPDIGAFESDRNRFFVTTTADSGTGTLRQAIIDGNTYPGSDSVYFSVPTTDGGYNSGAGVWTIAVTSALDAITESLSLDATTQPGFAARPVIELRGDAAAGAHGITVTGPDSVIAGFAINRFQGAGVVISGAAASGNTVHGNRIGTDASGTSALGNGAGVIVGSGASNTVIGGAIAASRNIISGNNGAGIDNLGAGTGTVIQGNYLGVNAAGTTPLPNYLFGNNAIDVNGGGIIGGSTAIAGTGAGNLFGGMVQLNGVASTVQGNTFGLQSDGNTVLAVSVIGTQSSSGIRTDSNGHLIGGTTAGLRNVFAGAGVANFNGNSFIDLFSDNNTVQGNYLGTGLSGLEDRSTAERGISAHGSNNLIGGTTADARNVVVGSYRGIEFNGPGNTAQGNYVGLGADGSTMLGNETWGIFVRNPVSTVGGDIAGAGNVVAGSHFGVRLEDTATGTIVAGNFIGTDATGMLARPNQTGLSIGTSNNIIGGTTADARNIISGNTETGVSMGGSGNRLEGNYIGVDATGNALLGAARINVATSGANTIGGLTTTPGTGAGNVIAGATGFNSANISSQNGATIQGNIVGLGANGSTDLSSGAWSNVLLTGQNNLVGGAIAGARNVLGGGTYQINMMDGYNTVQGNYIGTDASGMLSRNSTNHGIVIGSGSQYNQIGGTSPAARNIISGNAGVGIYLSGNSNTIQGNWVGLNAAGTALPNSMFGVFLFAYSGPSNNLIGGTAPGAGNVISGNTSDGIQMQLGQNNSVQGNLIGTDPTGSSAIANGGHGIGIYAGTNSSIGGTDPNAGNLISGNAQAGIYLISHPSIGDTGNITIQGNFLGTDASGMTAIPNAIGVQVVGGAHDISIGGATSSAGNVISGNTGVGVLLSDATTINNSVRGNLIGVKADGTTTLVNGGGAMSVTNGASLKGTGSFTGNVVNQGTVALGNSPGIVTINGNYTQSSNATLEMELEGANAAVPEFDQLIVNGTVSLNGTLDVSLLNSYLPSSGDSFRIIDNDGTDAINGTFTGLPEGTTFRAGNSKFSISYSGGTGNDVVLTNISAIFTVTTTSDSGPGSLRQAIGNANAHNGSDEIEFDLATSDPNFDSLQTVWTITPTSALPTISQAVSLDGTTQNEFTTRPVIELRGDSAGSGITGLTITAAGTTIEGLIINRFDGSGISLTGPGATGNVIRGNYLGVSADGQTDLGNAQSGIQITGGASNNLIGSNSSVVASAGSVILLSEDFDGYTGNQAGTQPGTGLELSYGGDLPGWTKAGLNAVHAVNQGGGNFAPSFYDNNVITMANAVSANQAGQSYTVSLDVGASVYTTLGQATQAGDGIVVSILRGNDTVLSAETFVPGAWVTGPSAQSLSTFTFTYTGDGSGDIRISISTNTVGADRFGGAVDNLIIQSGTYSGHNVISGNEVAGVEISSSNNNTVAGNIIGLNAAGTGALGNATGIRVASGSTGNTIGGNASTGPSNVISGNTGNGILLDGAAVTNTVIAGNYIGTDATGLGDLGNSLTGVFLSGAPNNVVGGTTAADRNIISGNNVYGVRALGADGNTILGNYVGLGADGSTIVANSSNGIYTVFASNTTIGGSTAGARNVVSGNGASGIVVDTGTGSVISGNYVGLTADGTAARMNAGKGIDLAAMTNATVGGLTTESRNVVVSNDGGIKATQGSHGTQILGNYVGTNAAGTVGLAVATDRFGIEINDSSNITIGGGPAGARNVILTGAGSYGVFVTNSSGLKVQGNLIGLDVTGMSTSASTRGILLTNVSATIGTDGDGTNDAAEGNVIAGASINIDLQGTAGTIIAGNLIGTNAAGTAILGTSTAGIRDDSTGSNRIGSNADGTSDAFERNVIAGATNSGIHATAPNTVIAGNFIGTNAAGDAALGNANGVQIHGSNITIGGTHAASRNVISGNTLGLNISAASTNNVVAGNYIGTNAAGTAALSNTQHGVYIAGTNNIIGGTTSGARNVISGNDRGVLMDFASNNTVQGNYIGTDYTGLRAIGNGVGVEIKGFGAPSAVGNVIGGSVVGAGNVISGNGIGVGLEGGGVANNTIAGNLIGLGVDGSTIVTNAIGVQVNNSHDNTIGGTTVAARNIISGNIAEGIILNFGAYENTIRGNYIGLDRTGTTAKPNNIGILVNGPDNVIGGTSAGAGNVISGNTQDGVLILNGISGTEIEGNYIGTSADGTSALGNGRDGIQGYVLSTTIARNVISGNARHGMDLGGESNTISGNFIGTNATGTAAIQNGAHGISSYSNNSIIGGFTPADRNIIVSANVGVSLSQSFNTRVSGNYIGTDVTGTQVLASGNPVGVSMFGHPAASNITIGGGEPGAGNVINVGTVGSGIGVHIQHIGGSNNKIQGNFIGTDPTGSFRVGNNWGVLVDWQNGVVIGTDSNGSNDATEGNVISGNVNGIMFGGFGGGGITGTVIAGNKIGTEKTGTRIIGNTNDGMQLNSYGSTRVGTNSDGVNDANEGNIIAGSGRAGIWFTGDNNVIAGNFIGTDTTETIALPNTYGIIAAFGAGHTIGGSAPVARNVIANSALTGLKLEQGTGNTGTFTNNSFFGNLYLAIDGGANGPTLNDAPDVDDLLNYPVVTSTLIVGNEMIVTGTMPVGKTVELYISAPSGNGVGQGRTRLTSVVDDSAADEDNVAGQFRVRIPIGSEVNHGTPLTALTLGSISEFSPIVFAGEVGSFLAPQITLSQSTVSITSGNAIDVEGSFYDPDSVSWDATVDYGDGSGVRPLTLNANNSFRLLHTYATTGNYTVTVVIRDTTLISSTKTLNVVVQNEAPTATFNEFTITSPANEGQLVTLTGRFEDTAGTHTATIQWGDGQTSSVVIVPGSREFTATHVYADDTNTQGTATPSDVYRVIVTITDETGANDTTPVGLFLEEIRNVLPSGLSVAFSSTSVLEGQAVSLSGLFTDPGMVDVHRVKVNWGDGTESLITLPVGARSFAGIPELTHVYTDDQNTGVDEYIVTVEVADDDEPQKAATMSQVIAVANALPSPVNASLNANVISENGVVALSGTFSDLGLADSHEVTVIWGDGSTPSAFSLHPGVVSFAGLSHQYRDNSASGSYTIEIRVADNDDPETYVSSFVTVYVQNIAPVVSPLLLSTGGSSINEGDSVTVSGSYSDTSPDDRHTVFVNWGDGTVSEAIVDLINRTFTATHRYLDNNGLPIAAVTPESTSIHNYLPYTITVSVDDQDGGIAAASVNQDVFNVAPVVEILPDAANSNPNLIRLISSIQDPGEGDTFTHGGAYRWTAEAVGLPGSIQTGNTAEFVVDRTAYPNALWRVTLEVADDDGGIGTFETTLLVGTNGDDQGANRLIVTDAMFNQAGTTNLMALALDGNDTIDASGVTDSSFSVTLVGGRGVDNLYGGAGDDIYVLAQGNDNANVPNADVATPVETGNDRYRLRPNSVLTVIDRDGSNILDFGLADFGITFDLSLNSSSSLVAQDVAPLPLTAPLHIVQTQGSFTQLEGSSFADRFTGASNASIFGGAGNDEFEVKAGTSGASFFGGADADVLRVTSSDISNLSFGGDAGLDTLINMGSITNLTFGGGADADILQNAGAILGNLDFGGDAGRDLLLNTGSITSLTFSGGADSDIFLNNGASATSLDFGGDADILLAGAGTIGNLVFEGDTGADTFVNLGAITGLTFTGGADNDVFINNGTLADSLNFGGDSDVLLVGVGTIGTLSFGGDAGADSLINRGSMGTLTFTGGADADLLRNTGTISNLNFGGDAGLDTLINAGSVVNLTFGGGADADVLLNSGTIIGNLSFGGDDGADSLTNSGGIASLVFTGGADADFLQNTGSISDLNFGGDAGLDSLINQGSIVSLTFGGGADADVLQNNAAGTITGLVFTGDAGLDSLVNLGTVGQLTFGGGADADVLRNVGSIGDLNFGGDAGSDLLVNEGAVTSLTFTGGADNDLLINAGTVLVDLNFGGDAGLDTLVNAGGLANLTFTGGADADVLKNSGTVSGNLVFGGDGGLDTLFNAGSVSSLTFNGGADADILQNTGTVTGTLVFGGDLGADLLTNTGTVGQLTFTGGADADVLRNSGTVVGDLVFTGDGGADLLVNRGSVGTLVFTGGADDDLFLNAASVGSLTFNGGADADVLQNEGTGIGSLVFEGGADNDVFVNNGSAIGSLVFSGGADNDIFVSNGNAIGSLVFTGDDGIPVVGQSSNDTLIVRGSGTGSPASQIRFDGGYGADAFENNATGFASIIFNGGQDSDTLLNNASGLASLVFGGDAGADVFVNHGQSVVSLTFTGGADDDIFLNDGLAVASLTFEGGADNDLLINSGDLLASLNFNGGADADIFVNKGNRIGDLVFEGGADADVLINEGAVVDSLVFNGDQGDDRLLNRKGGILVGSIVFNGDAGLDTLINDAAGISQITFTGGADADVLQNNGTVQTLMFGGGADADVLVNAGRAGSLTFEGGADADILLNRGSRVDALVFNGDAGIDTLFNRGAVGSLVFEGGADADVLQNDAAVDSLSFFGDVNGPASANDRDDTLVNNAPVGTLTFSGGADDDIFQNNAPVVSLTFSGGADADLLMNNGSQISSLVFNGDAGADTLISNGSAIGSLIFDGGADADSLRVQGRDIGSVTFEGGAGTDSFTFNAQGSPTSTVTFNAGPGGDFFAMRGAAQSVSFDGGQGNDGVLIVGSGAMTLTGGEGDDFYRFVSNPLADVTLTDAYTGLSDQSKDTLDFSSFTGGAVNIDLRLENVWQPQGTGQLRIRLADGMSIENIIGTSFADTIYGNARSNYLAGADFDEAFASPVAAPRGVTQWVLLDFDTHTNTGTVDPATGLPDTGEYVYSSVEREEIRRRVEQVYRGPNVGAPWFDLRVVNSTADLPPTVLTSGAFATIYFNQTPQSGRPGGLASEIDPGNVNLNGHAMVQVNGLLGGVVSIAEASASATPEGDTFGLGSKHKTGCGCPVCMSVMQDQSAGSAKPAGTSANFVALSSKIAAHELGHLLGLRHQDAFGPIGSGVHDPPGAAGYKPVYTGPSGGVETFDHIIGSPASVGSTRFDDLNELFFGEREAIKLAFANANPSQTTITNTGGNHSQATATTLTPVTLAVPNTLGRGVNQNKDFFVQITSVLGEIGIDSTSQRSTSDWYSFAGRAGELINIDVLSNSVARFGSGLNGAMTKADFLDTVVRVYNSAGQLVQYYDGLAENDDTFEPTDSSLIDLILPADDSYFIEVDSFHRFGDAIGDPQNPLSPLNAANPNSILAYPDLVARFLDTINDTDTGRYQLIMYKFRKASSSDMIDDLKGFGGVDVLEGGSGDSYEMTANLGGPATLTEGSLFTRTIQIDDRGASNWSGSTVDYGDGSGVQPLSVSATGEFTLSHVFGDNGSFTVTVTVINDIGQTLTQQFLANVDNVAPTASIVSISSTRLEGTAISFSGSASDAAGVNDTLTYTWSFGDGSPSVTGSDVIHTFADNGTYVITLTVSDEDGGVTSTTQTIVVDNVAPTASIVSISSTRLEGGLISFEGSATDPAGSNDTLTYLWNFGDGSPGIYGATPEYIYADNGTYVVTLTVTDGDGGSVSTTQTIIVQNVAPTASLAGPTSATTGTAVSIFATAFDPAGDADPLTYQWTVTRNGSAFATQSSGTNYTFTPTLAGTYVFSLTVNDGDGGVITVTHTLTVTATNTNAAPTVAITGPASGVRGHAITYQFVATDQDLADQAGLFTWTINWGDGSPIQTLTGPATVSVEHVFVSESTGSYTISAIAKDASNNASTPSTRPVQILIWQVQADPLQPGTNMLVIGGSEGEDRIRLTRHGSGSSAYYKLRIDHEDSDDCDDDEENEYTVRINASISGVIINGQNGDDRIELQSGINIWSILNGGKGDDRIKAGDGANILVGGDGNDRLEGQKGRDLLIGGRGSDRIDGGKDDDLLISGFTQFDDNREALLAIMREWNSSDSFTTRRSQLMGTTPGSLSGSFLLKPSGTNRTVFDDNALDELWGGEGRDWFLLNMNSAENSRVDRIRDWRNGDEDDDINLF